jgi:type IV pilus assembly protein PilC
MEEIAARMQQEAQQAIESAVAKVEPALILLTSGLVGVILLSVMIPMMNIMSAIG